MNHVEIVEHLVATGFNAMHNESCDCLSVSFDINGQKATLLHRFPEGKLIEKLPVFSLLEPMQFGHLAHLMYSADKQSAAICAGDNGTVSINYDVPTLVYEYALNRQVELVRQAATDAGWNHTELIREFSPNWALICDKIVCPTLYCAASDDDNEHVQTKTPAPKEEFGLQSKLLALAEPLSHGDVFKAIRHSAKWDSRPVSGKTIMLDLSAIEAAPLLADDVPRWYANAVKSLTTSSGNRFNRYARLKSKRHWVIFNASTPTGIVRCAVRFDSLR